MKGKSIKYACGLLGVAVFTGLDQLTKYLAVRFLQDGPIVIWDGVFELHYSINRGAAFGILQERRVFFILITCVILGALIWLYGRIPNSKKYLPLNILCVTVTAGALGNFLDRIRMEYVVDFLYFKLINFPVFNVADCYITLSCIVFALLVFLYYDDGDFAFMSRSSGRKKSLTDSEGD